MVEKPLKRVGSINRRWKTTER